MGFESKIRTYCIEYDLLDADEIVVGCSGGADSVALLLVLKHIFDGRITAVHVNHNLRGADSEHDRKFVEDLCSGLDISCKVFSFDVASKATELKRSLEDTGRILRYEAFREVASASGGKCLIALAHHKDDLAETMLMNIFRGSGLEGLCSPKPRNGDLIRPFLCVTKAEILDYLDSVSQEHCEDMTNYEEECTRNVWRNSIIPKIREVSVKEPSQALFETNSLLSSDLNFITGVVDSAFSECFDEASSALDIRYLRSAHAAISSRLVRMLWERSFGNLTDFESVHLAACLKLCGENTSSGTFLDMPFGRKAFLIDGRLGFCEGDRVFETCRRFAALKGFMTCEGSYTYDEVKGGALPCVSLKIVSLQEVSDTPASWFCPFDREEELGDLVFGQTDLKNRFKRAGSSSGKTLDKLLSDIKIPSEARGSVFAVSRGSEILWIPGAGHAIGFTDEVSKERFLASSEQTKFLAVSVKYETDTSKG